MPNEKLSVIFTMLVVSFIVFSINHGLYIAFGEYSLMNSLISLFGGVKLFTVLVKHYAEENK